MILKVDNLSKTINGNLVLSDISAEFFSGKIYGVVGNNGSGKTMLLRAIAGLITVNQGNVYVDGKELHKDICFPPDMGIVIEKPTLLENITGLENLKLLARIKNNISENDIITLMQKFSLDEKSKKSVKKYSLGMKQKLGIIQAIMENPKLLILDEPFNALDKITVNMLRELFLQYKKEDKLIIITSHNSEDIEILCDEIIRIENGKIIDILVDN